MDIERIVRLIVESDTPNTTLLFELLAHADRTSTSPLPPPDMEVLRAQAWYMADDPYKLAQANIERAPVLGPAPWCAFAWCDFTGFTLSPSSAKLNRDVWQDASLAWDHHRARPHALVAINVEVNINYKPSPYRDGLAPPQGHAITVPVSAFALTPGLYWRAELDSLRLLRDDQHPRSRLHGVLYLLAQRLSLSSHADNWVLCVLHGKYHMPFLVRMNPWCVVWVADDRDGNPSLQGGPGEMRHSVSIDPLNHLFENLLGFFSFGLSNQKQPKHTEEIIEIVNYFVAALPKLHRPPEKGNQLTATTLINLTHHSIYRITEQTQRNRTSDPFQHALSPDDTIDNIRRQMRG